jgi:DNA N-6-adenine-methyltransferase (Dam)
MQGWGDMSESPIHGPATGPLIEVPRRGEVVEFDPERHRLVVAALDYGIEEAKRIRDWPKLEEAVDLKIEEQRRFVAWWQGAVRGAGQPGKNSPGSRLMPCPKAEALTGMRQQRVSDLRQRLERPEKYRRYLLGATYCAALLAEEAGSRVQCFTGEIERYTPPWLIERVRSFFGGEIDLDPCSSPQAQQSVKAARFFTAADDALSRDWPCRNAFMNAPYRRDLLLPFIDKLLAEHAAARVPDAVALTNACTDTEWFDRLRGVATAICFTRGRIRFIDAYSNEATGSPPVGQALFYLGSRPDEFARHFSAVGWVVDPTRYRSAAR